MSMTIREVMAALQCAKPDVRVYYSFGHCVPTHVASWRGDYSEPALGWAPSGYSARGPVEQPTVADLLAELARATDGRSFDGWKGGEYSYTLDDTLHIDNRGDCSNTEISRIEDREYMVVIHTATED